MSDQPLPSPDPNRERISDAEALFREPTKPVPKARPKVRPADPSTIGQYEVQEAPPARSEPRAPMARPRPPEARVPQSRGPEPRLPDPHGLEPRHPEVNPFDDPWGLTQQPSQALQPQPQQVRTRSTADSFAPVSTPTTPAPPRFPELSPSEAVEQVWSRASEWGGTIAGMVIEAIVGFSAVYYLISIEEYAVAFIVMLLAGLFFVILSYPLMITLERPVRITPEQAVKDFFDALSHHFPHYVRMWLLLSTAGKVSSQYSSFEGFRGYWKDTLSRIRKDKVSSFTPLKFQVQDFKSEKSAGKTALDAVFTVRVLIRGRQAEGPIESFRVSMRLVKGPDRMWYLNKGTIK